MSEPETPPTDDELNADLAEARTVLAPLRRGAAEGEPDWAAMQAAIRDAVAREPAPARAGWRRAAIVGGGLAAVAAVALLLLWPAHPGTRPRTAVTPDAAAATDDDPVTDDELAAELEVPDDLGGITVDDALIDEAAALADDPEETDPELVPLLPDSAWIDDLSDEDLERAIEVLAKEAG